MQNKLLKQLRIGIVPSWLSECVSARKDVQLSDLLSFPKLMACEGQASILTETELFIYTLVQRDVHRLTDKVFCDLHTIAESEENLAFLLANKDALAAVEKKFNTDEKVRNAVGEDSAIGVLETNPLSAEYYTPVKVDGNTLLLIGSTTPVYQDDRAFYNAVIESLSGIAEFPQFKELEVFRRYLRHAVSGR
jgi:hypothetical protein